MVASCDFEISSKVVTRNLLDYDWAKSLGAKVRRNPDINNLLPNDAVIVQCNYFQKDTSNNWYVTRHRDLSVPVAEKIDSDQWSGWSTKEGTIYAHPPVQVLHSLLIVRIHLENNNAKNGALLMRPLLLHKSPKAQQGTRRVIHFVFGPADLPDGAEWPKVSVR